MSLRLTINDVKASKCATLNPKLFEEVPQKRSKYGNTAVIIDSIRFDSLKESRRYISLRMLSRTGEIHNLQVHPVFQLSVCRYIGDFSYYTKEGEFICEDIKSKITRRISTYRLKKKLMKSEKNIEIHEIL